MNNNDTIVKSYVIESEKRHFLSEKIGQHYNFFERFVTLYAASFMNGNYHSSYDDWVACKLSNGGLFLELTGHDRITLYSPNGFVKSVLAETFSVIVCLYALGHFLNWLDSKNKVADVDVVEELHSLLENYAYTLPESSDVMQALD